MEVKNFTQVGNLGSGALEPQKTSKVPGSKDGQSFNDTLTQIQGQPSLAQKKNPSVDSMDLRFSQHAIERMQARGIKIGPEDLGRLNEAVGRAASKGSRDSLILLNDSALIVSVKNKTVVTVMDKNALKENVFTNIDSTIVL